SFSPLLTAEFTKRTIKLTTLRVAGFSILDSQKLRKTPKNPRKILRLRRRQNVPNPRSASDRRGGRKAESATSRPPELVRLRDALRGHPDSINGSSARIGVKRIPSWGHV
uniref:Uncharacterized protein n=1 Tax=Anopheles albimanus TaxID=7167 RepID=A0A182FXN6_ANOAL